ncbi:hypothetical protein ACFV2X_38325 [Streptomyces sp. NPDC059679]|uniref:hypothetical protein n=1 Tax=Streptomyces sp. NPDC059679 TaxID=3346903 RepID=UPI00368FE7E5
MAPSETPALPSVDFLERELAVGDRVAFIATSDSQNPSLVIGRILVVHGHELCIESGHLVTRRGKALKAWGDKPDRYRHDGLYRLPEDDHGPDAEVEQLRNDLDEARSWARHGYEIGQKHCGWTDHGVAPGWLTDGWPNAFDSCEHLKQASELDTKLAEARAALGRVLALPEHPESMDAQNPEPQGYLHGYKMAIREAKQAAKDTLPPDAHHELRITDWPGKREQS